MNRVLKNSWALFLGMGAIMIAYGFQGSLLGVRAVKEEFSLTATGFIALHAEAPSVFALFAAHLFNFTYFVTPPISAGRCPNNA